MRRGGDFATECDPAKMTWSQLFWNGVSGTCAKFYEDQIIDPLWEIKPTTVGQSCLFC